MIHPEIHDGDWLRSCDVGGCSADSEERWWHRAIVSHANNEFFTKVKGWTFIGYVHYVQENTLSTLVGSSSNLKKLLTASHCMQHSLFLSSHIALNWIHLHVPLFSFFLTEPGLCGPAGFFSNKVNPLKYILFLLNCLKASYLY